MSSRTTVPSVAFAALFLASGPTPSRAQTLTANGSAHAFRPLAAMHGVSIGRLAVDPRNPNIVYAGTDAARGSILRSSDGGASWEVVSTSDPDDIVRAMAVDPADSSTVVAFRSTGSGYGSGTLYLSTDRGAHWRKFSHQPVGERGPASAGRGVVIDANGLTLVLADVKNGVFRSTDFGKSWTNPLPRSQARSYGLYTDPNDPETLWTAGLDTVALAPAAWVSHDFGLTWTKCSMPILDPSTGAVPTALAVQPGTGKILAAWSGVDPSTFEAVGGVIASRDGGETWLDSSSGVVGSGGPVKWISGNAMLFDPRSPNLVVVSGNGDLALKSVDGGITWSPLSTPVQIGTPDFRTFAIALGGGSAILGASANFVFKSWDYGDSWRRPSSTAARGAILMFETDPDEVLGLSAGGLIERSDDQGQSWKDITPPGAAESVSGATVDAFDTLYVPTRFDTHTPIELWQSRDRGRSWVGPRAIIPTTDRGLTQLLTDRTRAGRLYAILSTPTEFNLGIRSDDGGAHWTGFTVGFEGDFPAALTNPLVADDMHSGWLYAAMASGLWKSVDAGATWTLLPQLPLGAYGIAGLTVSQGVPYVVAGADDGTFSLQQSPDGGSRWSSSPAAFGTAPHEIKAVEGGRLVAYASIYERFLGGDCQPPLVAQSSDSGTSWAQVDLTQIAASVGTSCLSIMPTESHLYVGDPAGSGQTFGASWRVLSRAGSPASPLKPTARQSSRFSLDAPPRGQSLRALSSP